MPAVPGVFRVLLLDVSQLFSADSSGMLYDMVEEPLGLMYLATYIHETFGSRVRGKVAKSRIDFDSFDALKQMIDGFKPHLIGIRTLSYYKAFFHQTVSVIRQWGVTVPIISGGPYASGDYKTMLRDTHVDLAVLGEGELTLADLIEKIMANNNKLPGEEVLNQIKGIAFIKEQDKARLRQGNREIIAVDRAMDRLAQYPDENLEHVNRPEDLLYLISTSGSTGRPKNVMVEHGNLVNLLNFEFSGTDVDFSGHVLQFASIGFDVSAQEIFSTFLKGGKLFLISKDLRADVLELFDFIEASDIGILFLPPAFLKLVFTHPEFAASFPRCVRHICAAGEQLMVPEPLKRHLAEHKVFLHNHYGPAETHVVTTLTIDPAGPIPGRPGIGEPIGNTKIHILDRYQNLQPIGVKGELYISGSNVGRGYLNNPELTTEKFVISHLSLVNGQSLILPMTNVQCPMTFYRTGDLARWLPDGTIEFLGRADHQVKLRGFRVELEEIETQLLRQKGIKEAVVIAARDERGDMNLCAYFVPGAGEVAVQQLREALEAVLPDYMVPAHFISLEKIPLNTSGKLDRKALPVPGLEAGDGYRAPSNDIQKTLAAIWAGVLEVEPGIVGIDTNFFNLGGHSLKATVLLAKIYKELNVKVPLTEMFKAPTIRNMSGFIQAARKDKYRPIQPVEKKEYHAASQTQKRLYFQWQMGGGESMAYNMPQVVVLGQEPDRALFEETFRQLIRRHESLRTSFRVVNEEPVQVIHETAAFSIESLDLSLMPSFIRPFDLSRAPLLRVGLAVEKEKKYLLMVDMHHIISDGISLDLLVEDFKALYAGEAPAPLPVQYKDYTQWRNRQFYEERDRLTGMENYWLTRFQGEIPVLTLPYDFPRPGVRSIEGGAVDFEMGKGEAAAVRDFALTSDVTVYMVLLAVFNVLLSKLGGGEDIIVGTPTSGRKHPDLERIIGMFANALPLRNYPAGRKTFKQFLESLRKTTLEAFENEDYPFEELLEKIKLKRDAARTPLFDVMFAFHSLDALAGNTGEQREEDSRRRISKYDMTLFALEAGDGLFFTLVYCTRLFKQSTIETFTGYFKKILADVLEDPDRPIADIEMISRQEQAELLKKIRDKKGNAFTREVETEVDVPGIEAEFDF